MRSRRCRRWAQRASKGERAILAARGVRHQPARRAWRSCRTRSACAEPPRIIEGIDIAHLQGGEMVGSQGLLHRRRAVQGRLPPLQDQARPGEQRLPLDPGSRQPPLPRGGANNELYPDVILIDGGLGQLHAAMDVFKTMDVKPPMVISLAKKEELVYVQAKTEPIRLPRNNTGPEAAAVHPRRGPPLRPALPPHPAAQVAARGGREAGASAAARAEEEGYTSGVVDWRPLLLQPTAARTTRRRLPPAYLRPTLDGSQLLREMSGLPRPVGGELGIFFRLRWTNYPRPIMF